MKNPMIIGVLALQGGFSEHMEMLEACGVKAVALRTMADVKALGSKGISGVILPGGESTTIMPMLEKTGLGEWLTEKSAKGLPIFGTCAGLIALSKGRLNLLDITVDRNAYGGQLQSFEAELKIPMLAKMMKAGGGKRGAKTTFTGVFIRAPRIKKTGQRVAILASHEGAPVLVESKNILGASFHPELTNDKRIHQYFLEKCLGDC